MQFLFLVAHYSNNDAVCNDAIIISELLQSQGHQTYFYSPTADTNFKKELITKEKLKELTTDPGTIVIYEHCIYLHQFAEIFAGAHCKIWFRYQNITPPHFYEPYDKVAANATRMGLAQTKQLVHDPRIEFFLPGSEFTANDLRHYGADPKKIHVIAPISRLDDFAKCQIDLAVKNKLTADSGINNLLFVGRVVPNKGHRHLIEILSTYFNFYGPKVHLWIVGNLVPNYKLYYQELERLIDSLQVGNFVTFTGSVSFDTLHTYYQFSDTFLLMSEHEGFCVPITEAQYHGLPIIAVDCGPFEDAVGENQLILKTYDYNFIAAACAKIKTDQDVRDRLISAGKENLSHFIPDALNKKIADLIDLSLYNAKGLTPISNITE